MLARASRFRLISLVCAAARETVRGRLSAGARAPESLLTHGSESCCPLPGEQHSPKGVLSCSANTNTVIFLQLAAMVGLPS
mmetsp:Transcript_81696/g.147535  ORF Transcript_81696/g.147535 Transcript_81696/m.147535 type:complete len:81 (+) Transcript_81696:54-296(+)